jgi:hypothetical protein
MSNWLSFEGNQPSRALFEQDNTSSRSLCGERSPILTFECWVYGGLPAKGIFRVLKHETGLEDWLLEDAPRSESGSEPQQGLRVIFAPPLNDLTFNVDNDQMDSALKSFNLPISREQVWPKSTAYCVGLHDGSDRTYSLTSSAITPSAFCLLRHVPTHGITVGCIKPLSEVSLANVLDRFIQSYLFAPHPLLLPLLLHESEIALAAQRLVDLHAGTQAAVRDVRRILCRSDGDLPSTLIRLGQLHDDLSSALDRTLPHLVLRSKYLARQVEELDGARICSDEHQTPSGILIRSILPTSSSILEHLELYRSSLSMVQDWEQRVRVLTADTCVIPKTNRVHLQLLNHEARATAAEQSFIGKMHLHLVRETDQGSDISNKVILILTVTFVPSTFIAVSGYSLNDFTQPSH